MKFEKIDYYILVNHLTENVGRITKRESVTGYTPADYSNIAIRKKNEWWYVDHIPTGFGIVTIGCKTRAAAFKEYEEHYAGAVEKLEADREKFRNAVEMFENAPFADEVEKWETINFISVYDHRFYKVTDAAKAAGLLVKKADDITYTAGGNVNIIGDPEKLQAIKEMIERYKEMDAAAAIQKAAIDTERKENNSMVTFTADAVLIGENAFKAVYKYKEDPAAVIIEIVSVKTGREYAPIIIEAGARYFEEARAFVPSQAAETEPAADDAFLTVDDAEAEKSDLDFLCDYTEEKPAPKKREQKTRKPAALDPAKAARGPVPAKDFINTEITGRGWRILFDGEENRTRVIFEKCPTKEVRKIVKDAGFYWSPAMGSWNKKLTFKAYRAALELAKALQDVRRIAA